jgi:hypothetical protein
MTGLSGAQTQPGWELEPDLGSLESQLRRRRWRVLRAALPPGPGLDPVPGWIKSPDQFIEWLAHRLNPAAVRRYFIELELIAKQTCDLELLRLARHHKSGR